MESMNKRLSRPLKQEKIDHNAVNTQIEYKWFSEKWKTDI